MLQSRRSSCVRIVAASFSSNPVNTYQSITNLFKKRSTNCILFLLASTSLDNPCCVTRTIHTVNLPMLKAWLSANAPTKAIAHVMLRTGVSLPTAEKLLKGKAPKLPTTRLAIAAGLGLTEDELFPVASTKKRSA